MSKVLRYSKKIWKGKEKQMLMSIPKVMEQFDWEVGDSLLVEIDVSKQEMKVSKVKQNGKNK